MEIIITVSSAKSVFVLVSSANVLILKVQKLYIKHLVLWEMYQNEVTLS